MKRISLILFFLMTMLAVGKVHAQQIVNGNRVYVSGTGQNIQCPNDTTTGTTISLLAKMTSTGCIKIGTGDVNVPVWIVTSASATSGSASLAVSGQAACVMDSTIASNAEGDYVIASTTTAGQCHAQSAQPTGVFIIGSLQDNTTSSGLTSKVQVISSFNPAGAPCVTTNLSLQFVNTSVFGCATPFTFASNTITAAAAGIVDLHAETSSNGFLFPTIAGAAPSTNGSIAYDTTANEIKAAISGATNIIPTISGTTNPTTNTLAQWAAGGIVKGVDFSHVFVIPAANCNGVISTTIGGAGWSIGAGGTATCRGGTNNKGGFISITDTSSTFATFQIPLPEDWDSATNPYIRFGIASTDTTSGHTIIPSIQVACYKGDGTTTDDVAPNAAHSLSTVTLNTTANQYWSTANVQMNSTDMTGCVVGALMQITVGRATDTATNAEFYEATVTIPRLPLVQAN